MAESNDKKTAFLNSIKKATGKITETTSSLTEGVKETAVHVRTSIEKRQEEKRLIAAEKKKEEEIGNLSPIFADELTSENFQYERVIRIVNYDNRLEYEEMKGAVGFYELIQDRRLPTVLSSHVRALGFAYYPQLSESLYIADPCIDGKYIEADQYYNYMKQVRVNELIVVAQSLGAKHVTIKYTEASKTTDFQNAGIHASAGGIFHANADKKRKNINKESVSIWADSTFKPSVWSGPVMPNLLYFRNESDINSLIQMVLASKSKLKEYTYHFQASTSSGLALSEAASIESAKKAIDFDAGVNLEAAAEKESKSILEYTIKFI